MIIGKRGAAHGIWVSPAGVDVDIAADADLLISSTLRRMQLMHFGATSTVNGNTTLVVNYGRTHPVVPAAVVEAGKAGSSGFLRRPWAHGDLSGVVWRWTPLTSGISIRNAQAAAMVFHFFVFNTERP